MSRNHMNSSLQCKLSFKLIVIGQQGVGKTSLIVRYIKDIFSKDYKVTVGFEFYSKVVTHEGEDVNLQVWDTAGQEAFRAMIRSFYRNACCVFLIFSLDKPNTLDALNRWIKQVNQHSNNSIVKILVGTKSDLVQDDDDIDNKIKQFQNKHNIDFTMKVSSKNSNNIHDVFTQAVKLMYNRYQQNEQYRQLVSPNKQSFLLPADNKQSSSLQTKKKKKQSDSCC